MSLPLFLRGLDDANFHLLNAFNERPVRIAAISVTGPTRLAPCRVFEFNALGVQCSQDDEARLQEGLYIDEVAFNNNNLIIEHDVDSEEELKVVIELSPTDWGRFFECELPPITDTPSIAEGVRELCDRGEVEWRRLNWAVGEEAWISDRFRQRARVIGNDEIVWSGKDILGVLDDLVSADAIILGVEAVEFPNGGDSPMVEAISDASADIRKWQDSKSRGEVLDLARRHAIAAIERSVGNPYRNDIWYCVVAQKEDVGPPKFFWVSRDENERH